MRNLFLVILFALQAGAVWAQSSAQIRSQCDKDIADLKHTLDSLNNDYHTASNEMSQGLYCHKCCRSQTQLGGAALFQQHIYDARKAPDIDCSAQLYQAYMDNFNAANAAFKQKQQDCNDQVKNAWNQEQQSLKDSLNRVNAQKQQQQKQQQSRQDSLQRAQQSAAADARQKAADDLKKKQDAAIEKQKKIDEYYAAQKAKNEAIKEEMAKNNEKMLAENEKQNQALKDQMVAIGNQLAGSTQEAHQMKVDDHADKKESDAMLADASGGGKEDDAYNELSQNQTADPAMDKWHDETVKKLEANEKNYDNNGNYIGPPKTDNQGQPTSPDQQKTDNPDNNGNNNGQSQNENNSNQQASQASNNQSSETEQEQAKRMGVNIVHDDGTITRGVPDQSEKVQGNIPFEEGVKTEVDLIKDNALEKHFGKEGGYAAGKVLDALDDYKNVKDGKPLEALADESRSSNPVIKAIQTEGYHTIFRTTDGAMELFNHTTNAKDEVDMEKAERLYNNFMANAYPGTGVKQSISNAQQSVRQTAANVFTEDNAKKAVVGTAVTYWLVEGGGGVVVAGAGAEVVGVAIAVVTCLPCLAIGGIGYMMYRRHQTINKNNEDDQY